MTKMEMLGCEYKSRILLFVAESKKKEVGNFFQVWCEHQFLSKAPKSIQKDRKWRVQICSISAYLRQSLKRIFGKDHLAKVINLYIHGSLYHFAIDFELGALSEWFT